MSNFGILRYFQTFLSLGVEQGFQKLPKFDINDLKLLTEFDAKLKKELLTSIFCLFVTETVS